MANEIHTDVLVVGAGQAGLSTSYYLKKNNIDHLVLERGQIGDSWHKRWDSFRVNSANKYNLLPGQSLDDLDGDQFMTGAEYASRLIGYADTHRLPVKCDVSVLSLNLEKTKHQFFIQTKSKGQPQNYVANKVVIASGGQNHPFIPQISQKFPAHLLQLHSADYRNPRRLPNGGVLIVGSATSGVQIAEELLDHGREVYMSTSAVARTIRQYRGRDLMDWMVDMRFFEKPTAQAEPFEIMMKAPLASGLGDRGHTISLQMLSNLGAKLYGYLQNVEGDRLSFDDSLMEHLAFGDNFSNMVRGAVDQYINAAGIDAPPPVKDEADEPFDPVKFEHRDLELNLSNENIRTIIWGTGFHGDFSWVNLPVLNERGQPVHYNGTTSVDGLYFMGLPWLRNLKSSLIFGVDPDAYAVVEDMLSKQKQAKRVAV